MRRTPIAIFLGGTALSIFAAEAPKTEDWKLVKQASGVTIYSQPHPGSRLKEFKAIGEIDAPTTTVHNVIDDVEGYSSFMPYTVECRVIARDHDSIISYQRLSPKIVSDRDYTLRIRKASWPTKNGLAYLNRWEPANENGPPEKPGVFRVKVCDGSWLLEPAEHKTHATYHVFTDSGVNVLPFVANAISATGIIKLFAAIRKQAANSKYRAK